MRDISGLLLLDKIEGFSSFQEVRRIKRVFDAKKAGHTGSLDVLACGLLPVCLGRATKFARFLLDADKTYLVRATLGIRTATGDREGAVIETKPVPVYTRDQLESVLRSFLGHSLQLPPMYSALKYQGQCLYQLARRGEVVDRPLRPITIHQIELLSFGREELMLSVSCSKGTYIRTLIEDMGERLSCGAYVTFLRRIRVGNFKESSLMTVDALQQLAATQGIKALDAQLLPIASALKHLPHLELSTTDIAALRVGRSLCRPNEWDSEEFLGLYDAGENFLGVGKYQEERLVSEVLI